MATLKQLEELRDEVSQKLISSDGQYDEFNDYDPIKQEGDTRQQIARIFVIGYFGLFALILMGVPAYNALIIENPSQIDLENTLQIFGTLIGTSLGFVVGYYFKSQSN